MAFRKDTHLRRIQHLTQPVTSLKGIGPSRARLLAQKGIFTVLDLLFFNPIRYEDRTRILPIRDIREGDQVFVKGKVISGGEERFRRSGRSLFKILLGEGDGFLELVWFQYRKPYLASLLAAGTTLLAYGTVRAGRTGKQMIHPEIRALGIHAEEASLPLGILPVYSAVPGISPAALRLAIREALHGFLPSIIDPVPRDVTRDMGLPDLGRAIRDVHAPPVPSSLERLNRFDTPFHRRLLFDRFFLVLLVVAFLRGRRGQRSVPRWSTPSSFWSDLKEWFPFELTGDQVQAVRDIVADTAAGKPMNRLILGDVGCGKTVVAALAAHLCTRNGRQAALMVPTQILAGQHLEVFQGLPDGMGFRPILLTGRVGKGERTAICKGIREGRYNLVIGTHSLIQEDVAFSDLGLIIIDEQQRFGVRERAMLDRKGPNAHQLVMTATPIPRTLAITLYGDTDLSIIEQIPGHRSPVVTRLATGAQKRDVLETLRKRLSGRQRAFVICPVIEGQEERGLKDAVQMAAKLRKILTPPHRIGLIHGRLPPEERERVMEDFRKGLIHVLVGTTVVEVGVHVPEATLMIIEHPERFGLSQLHQLRGRVGRGAEPGLCILMVAEGLPERVMERLRVLEENHDGFQIARKDLEQRGHGEFIGMRQSGIGELDISEMLRESGLLSRAKQAAERVIQRDPDLSAAENAPLRSFVRSMLETPVDI